MRTVLGLTREHVLSWGSSQRTAFSRSLSQHSIHGKWLDAHNLSTAVTTCGSARLYVHTSVYLCTATCAWGGGHISRQFFSVKNSQNQLQL